MNKKRMIVGLSTILICSALLPAQDKGKSAPKHHTYKLYDMGTFGGNSGIPSVFAVSATAAGVIGGAETALADPFDPNCLFPDCQVGHAFRWRNGVTKDLGALPGNSGLNSSYGFSINDNGTVVGVSENGAIDPDTGNPETVAVVWKDGKLTNLGTLGGAQSLASMVNNRGQIVGWAMNDVPDPYSSGIEFIGFAGLWAGTTQLRAVLWDATGAHDLGTLGGPSALAYSINQAGQIVGQSYTSNTPNASTGIPTVDAFLWQHGKMTDLGTLGGTITAPYAMNNQGQVIGQSNLVGDQSWHGFVWSRGKLTDLNLGGSFAAANWISDSGDVIGQSTLSGDQAYHAFLWNKKKVTDLGTLPGEACSIAYGVNSQRQVVGASYAVCDVGPRTAFISENGGAMAALDSLIQPPSSFHVYAAWFVTERGEIVASGRLPNGDPHVVFLVPNGHCDNDDEQMLSSPQNSVAMDAPPATAGTTKAASSPAHPGSLKRFGQDSIF